MKKIILVSLALFLAVNSVDAQVIYPEETDTITKQVEETKTISEEEKQTIKPQQPQKILGQ